MSLCRTICLSLIFLAGMPCAGLAWAQATAAKPKYAEFGVAADLFADERAAKDFYTKQVVSVLRGRVQWGDQARGVIDKWFMQKELREFTHQKNWNRLPELRAALLKEAKSASSPQAAAYLNDRILLAMKTFIDPSRNLHPAVRYNAMLLIGDMNDMEGGTRDAQGRRILYDDPMMEAFNVLMREFTTTKSDAMRVAAQVGILRHAKLDQVRLPERRLDAARRSATVTAMLSLVNSDPPAGRSAAGHTWMQRRGIEIMAALEAVGSVPQVHATLEKIVADDAKPMSLRCTAAEALSHWRQNSQAKFDAQMLAESLGRLGGKALSDELAFIVKLQETAKLKQQIRELIADTSTVMTAATSTAGSGGSGGEMSNMMMEGGYSQGGDDGDEDDGMSMMAQMFGGGEGMSAMMGGNPLLDAGPEDPRVTRSRRRLKYQLACIQAGLDGVSSTPAAAAKKAEIDKVIAAVKAAYSATDPQGSDLPALEKSIKTGLKALAFLMPEEAAADTSPLPPGIVPGEPGAPAAPDPGAPAPPDPAAPAPADPGAPAPAAPDPGIPAPADPAAPAQADPAAPAPADPGAPAPDPAADPLAPAAPGEPGAPAPAPGAPAPGN